MSPVMSSKGPRPPFPRNGYSKNSRRSESYFPGFHQSACDLREFDHLHSRVSCFFRKELRIAAAALRGGFASTGDGWHTRCRNLTAESHAPWGCSVFARGRHGCWAGITAIARLRTKLDWLPGVAWRLRITVRRPGILFRNRLMAAGPSAGGL